MRNFLIIIGLLLLTGCHSQSDLWKLGRAIAELKGYVHGFEDGMKAGAEQAFQNDISSAYSQGKIDGKFECEHPTVSPSSHGF